MEKFLEKMQQELNDKILSCVNGKSIVKESNKVYTEVRKKSSKKVSKKTSEAEKSIYDSVIQDFLKENPELIAK